MCIVKTIIFYIRCLLKTIIFYIVDICIGFALGRHIYLQHVWYAVATEPQTSLWIRDAASRERRRSFERPSVAVPTARRQTSHMV